MMLVVLQRDFSVLFGRGDPALAAHFRSAACATYSTVVDTARFARRSRAVACSFAVLHVDTTATPHVAPERRPRLRLHCAGGCSAGSLCRVPEVGQRHRLASARHRYHWVCDPLAGHPRDWLPDGAPAQYPCPQSVDDTQLRGGSRVPGGRTVDQSAFLTKLTAGPSELLESHSISDLWLYVLFASYPRS